MEGARGERHFVKPVSYTHLDVYKRQVPAADAKKIIENTKREEEEEE